jgi:hypothetical protein
MSKVLADCEVIYILVFLGQAKMAKASYFEGGMLAAIKWNSRHTRANG